MNKKRRIEGLDILRAIALIMISVYHWFSYQGMYVGVIVFFALSGYLVTDNLLKRDFTFWEEIKKRIVRIYPSLLTIILFSTLAIYFLNGGLEDKYRASAIYSVFGLNNLFQIIYKISYFDKYNTLLPLTHIWALSFQLQMYIILPLLIIGFRKVKMSTKNMSCVFFGISLISALIMGYKFYNGVDFSVIYYGTDTRMFTFFIAAAVAAFYYNRKISLTEKTYLLLLSIIGYILLISYSFFIDYQNPYYGGLYIMSLLVSLIAVLLVKTNIKKVELPVVSHILSFISFIGKREYQYYLWQFPIMIFLREIFKWSTLDFSVKFLIEIIVLIVISEISYYIFEKKGFEMKKILIGLFILTVGSVYALPDYVNKDLEEMNKIREEQSKVETETPKVEENKETVVENKENGVDDRKISFVGDSVMEMTKTELKKKYPNAVIDSKVSRQFSKLPGILEDMKSKGTLYDTVVIGLGTNGTISKKDLEKVLDILGNREIYFINVVVPDSWEKSVNAEIKNLSETYPNVKMIDWYSVAKGNREIFYKDGTHPKQNGVKKYVDLVYSTISGK
ncbi:acyltransferase family protein [Pseudostreptobacillus hongkongensis]|uniref:acyltransferase family protein n=1 Tax=Pseudostreptobacillus hongkongensis TaxID=1162717 RepID=UPI0028D5CE72|nr:acyltransferase family protein [Pseudostreptobacillus hongkongensis]